MTRRTLAILLGLPLFAAACQTPCQRVCIRMADYAEECGFTVSDAELQTCLDEQADAPDQGACRRAGDPQTIRSEWTCDDLAVFFSN